MCCPVSGDQFSASHRQVAPVALLRPAREVLGEHQYSHPSLLVKQLTGDFLQGREFGCNQLAADFDGDHAVGIRDDFCTHIGSWG
jgi:hypothetical protein